MRWRFMIWLYLCLTVPSLAQVHKYFGWPGVAAYLAITALALWLLRRLQVPGEIAKRITDSQGRWLSAAVLLVVLIAFIGLYPVAHSGVYGPGSDSADSLNVAVREMLHGRYPYYARTYLGNPVHEMPGMLLLATPFVLLGNSAYMNLFWLALFLLVCREELGDARQALLLFVAMLVFCPVVMQQVVTGGDQLANGLFTMVLLWWMTRRDQPIAAVLFGVALSSRANFLLLVPLAFGHLLREYGGKRAVRDLAIAAATFVLVTLPFYFHDPENFTPLWAANRLTRFDEIVPHLGAAIGAAGLLLTIWLAVRGGSLLANCVFVQGFFVIVGAVLSRDLFYASYGVFFLFFGLAAFWKQSVGNTGMAHRPSQAVAWQHAG